MELNSLTDVDLDVEMRSLATYSDNSDDSSPFDDSVDDNDALLSVTTPLHTSIDSSGNYLPEPLALSPNAPSTPSSPSQTPTSPDSPPQSSKPAAKPSKKRSRPKSTHALNKPPKDASCRICSCRSPSARLISPCACTGSVAYVHTHCLQRWVDSRPNKDNITLESNDRGVGPNRPVSLPYINDAPTSTLHVCEMCHTPYNIELELKYKPSSRRCWSSASVGAGIDVCLSASMALLGMGISVGMIGNLVQVVNSEKNHPNDDGSEGEAGANDTDTTSRTTAGQGPVGITIVDDKDDNLFHSTNSIDLTTPVSISSTSATPNGAITALYGPISVRNTDQDDSPSRDIALDTALASHSSAVIDTTGIPAAHAGDPAAHARMSTIAANAGISIATVNAGMSPSAANMGMSVTAAAGDSARYVIHPFGSLEADMCVVVAMCLLLTLLSAKQTIKYVFAWRAHNSVVRIKSNKDKRSAAVEPEVPGGAEVVIGDVSVDI